MTKKALFVSILLVFFLITAASLPRANAELWNQTGSDIYYQGGNVGIGTATPGAKLDVNGPIRANKHLTHTTWFNLGGAPQGSWVPGYMKLITPIVHNEGNMFQIRINGYRYGTGGTPVDIICGGYAYSGSTLISTDIHVEGTNDPVGMGVENGKVVVTIGSGSNIWYYDHFTFEYSGWAAKRAEDFHWEFVYNTPPLTTNKNNVYVDDSAGTITTTGNVGIGTTSPSQRLDVNGAVAVGGQSALSSDATSIKIGDLISGDGIRQLVLRSGDQDRVTISTAGNVGIGTTSPQSKLAVKGTITAQEIKVVDTSGWADHVFSDGYNLPSLESVEAFISREKHLPDIPTAGQIQKEGIAVSEILTKQMQKIEELTLYLIELKKQNDELITRVAMLENKH